MTAAISKANPASQQTVAAGVAAKASSVKAAAKLDSDGDRDGSSTHVSVPSATKVTISAAGLAAAAANKEALETPAQTAREAQGSDMQAKRLMAKEQAAIKAERG